jgi:heptaprenyl diphosphate synthase
VCTDAALGKPAGHDIVEGVYTLPVIRALATASVGDELRALLGSPLDNPTRDKARDLVRATDAVVASVVAARRYADQAADALTPLGDSATVHALANLGHRMLDELEVD